MLKFFTFLLTLLMLSNAAIAQTAQQRQYVYMPILGQSNASEMHYFLPNTQYSPLMMLENRLTQHIGIPVVGTLNRNARLIPPTNGSTIDGDYGSAGDSRIWWHPNTNRPGGALSHAINIMRQEVATLQQTGIVRKVGVIWWQGENDTMLLGGSNGKPAEMAKRYQASMLQIFAYIQSIFGQNVDFYLVQSAPPSAEAARHGGVSAQDITFMQKGAAAIQRIQSQLAANHTHIHVAAHSHDLTNGYASGIPKYRDDIWHLAPNSYATIATRLADYIANDLRR